MSYNQILYWKWDDSDFIDQAYIKKIDDIAQRSAFDTLLVSFTWCDPRLNEKVGHDAIAAAVDRIHSHGMKFFFDIDVRPVRSDFLERYPDRKLGIVHAVQVDLDDSGCGCGSASTSTTGDHYGEYAATNIRLLRAYSYNSTNAGYTDLSDITGCCKLESADPNQARISFNCDGKPHGSKAIAFVVFDYSYPDIFCSEVESYHKELLDIYADIPLDGVTIDEWGTFPHPGFDFQNAWRKPWYSDSFAESYKTTTGRDIILDFLNTQICPKDDTTAQLNAINDYYYALIHQMGR